LRRREGGERIWWLPDHAKFKDIVSSRSRIKWANAAFGRYRERDSGERSGKEEEVLRDVVDCKSALEGRVVNINDTESGSVQFLGTSFTLACKTWRALCAVGL
jgi:hypothetical protein